MLIEEEGNPYPSTLVVEGWFCGQHLDIMGKAISYANEGRNIVVHQGQYLRNLAHGYGETRFYGSDDLFESYIGYLRNGRY
jgi:hypothetical protein